MSMIFKDRQDAGEKLVKEIEKQVGGQLDKKNTVVVSLLRGGIIVGEAIAKKLSLENLPLIVTKISSYDNPELAIGAYCFGTVYLEDGIIQKLGMADWQINRQISLAQQKFRDYRLRFNIRKKYLARNLVGKTVIVADDGVATGATVKVAEMFIAQQKPQRIILAVPVAPEDFDTFKYDQTIILQQTANFSAVSQFYEHFPQVSDEEVKNIITNKYQSDQ